MATFNRSPAAVVGYFGAALAIGVSAAQNILTGWALGAATSPIHAATFAIGSAAGAFLQPVSWLAAFVAFKRREFGRGLVALALGAACLLYATLSSLGFVSIARTDATAARATGSDTFQLNKSRADVALAELKALAVAPQSTKKVEAQRAERRASLERTIAGAQKALHAETSSAATDPQAASLAAYAAAAGLSLTAAQIAPWISAAAVLFFELCAGAALLVAAVLAVPDQRLAQTEVEFSNDEPQPYPTPKKRGRRRTVLPDEILSRIRDKGGRLNGSLHSIGRVIGIGSKASIHRNLRELEAAGAIELEATGEGTRLSLIK